MKLKSLLFSCLLGSVGVLSTQAIAGGSIGGDCCADLEERVAELEATTVRKGNRKVTLTVSGFANAAIFFNDTDNGVTDRGVTIGQTALYSRFRFTGGAKINSDLSAGYRIEFAINPLELGSFERGNGLTPTLTTISGGGPLHFRYNELWVASKTFGKLSIGQGSTASDFSAEVDLSGTNYYADGATNSYSILGSNDGFSRAERIRYDTPSIAGFKASASWQENGNWDAALRYAGALGDFTAAGAIAYFETDAGVGRTTGSASIIHRPTGLSLTGAFSEGDALSSFGRGDYWYVKGGIKRNIFAAGYTALSVDYQDYSDYDQEKIGLQLVQSIDAAAMKIGLSIWDVDSAGGVGPEETAGSLAVTISF